MEIAVTVYEKMKTNAKGNFTNSDLFKENGGHITKNHRIRFNYIKDNNATFQEYFLKFHNKPYDNYSSMTIDNCDFIIRHENIAEDYLLALNKAGVETPFSLPVVNKTAGKKNDLSEYYTKDIRRQTIYIFGPFLAKYNYCFPENWGDINIPLSSTIKFKIMSVLRRANERFVKKHPIRKSILGTIYGKIQRKEAS